MKELIAKLRALCSETCELSPEIRMNHLVKTGWEAATVLHHLVEVSESDARKALGGVIAAGDDLVEVIYDMQDQINQLEAELQYHKQQRNL